MFMKHMRHIVSGAKSRRRTIKKHMKHTGGKKTLRRLRKPSK